MKLHKAGYHLLIKLFLLLFIFNGALYFAIPNKCVVIIIASVSLVLYLLSINFFRFPNRAITVDDNIILAPADGKVVVIEEVYEPEYFKEKRLQVSIFMNVFNVHINWFPVNGIVSFYKHHKGKYMAAYLPKSSTENERSTIVIKTNKGPEILMRQIAGALARRIVSYTPVGALASQKEHAGFIKFGSRVDLYLPLGTKIDVELEQKTVGSQTIIGRLN